MPDRKSRNKPLHSAKPQFQPQRLGHAYEKNSRTMYRELEKRQAQAIQRAERLSAEYGAARNPQLDNPCTTVHLLVQELCRNIHL